MSIENGVFNSCTPAECYVSKQVASWVIITKVATHRFWCFCTENRELNGIEYPVSKNAKWMYPYEHCQNDFPRAST